MTDLNIAAESTIVAVATYQVRENYGAHDWDGTGECPQYWKSKGASYKLVAQGTSWVEVVGDMPSLFARAAAMGANNEGWSESLLDVDVVFLNEARRDIEAILAGQPDADVGYLRFEYDNDIVWDHICGSNYADRSPARETLARLQAG